MTENGVRNSWRRTCGLLFLIISTGAAINILKRRHEKLRQISVSDVIDSPDYSVAEDRAWRIHAALADWTGKVDSKATFCFALESGALVVVANLTSDGRLFGSLHTSIQKWIFALGVLLLIAGVLCAALVIAPRMNRAEIAQTWKTNTIYFGHLRLWETATLEKVLQEDSILPSLSAQLTAMSKIAWRKHLIVQWSLILGLSGAFSLGISAYLTGTQ
jgi:hypothetical protein